MKPEDYGYVVKNNLCLFQKGPLSQWWGGFKGQESTFKVDSNDLYLWYVKADCDCTLSNARLLDKISREYKHLYFNCCEQWMMACKAVLFNDGESFKKIMDEKSPQRQKDLGRKILNYNQQLWDHYKFEIVSTGNRYKFDQNKDLKDFLISFNYFTVFAEAAPWDSIWGIGLGPDDPKSLDIYTWQGENLLGKVITNIRQSYD